ncbi:MAG: proteasome subunit alpha, partial [Nitrososphaera sp.]
GAGSDQVTEFLEKSFRSEMGLEEAAALAIESIYLVSEEKTGTRHLKMAIIDSKAKTMRKAEDEEIQGYATTARDRASKRGA